MPMPSLLAPSPLKNARAHAHTSQKHTSAHPSLAGAVFSVFVDVDATLLEMNPFTLDPATGQAFPLDMRMELDDTAAFRSASK